MAKKQLGAAASGPNDTLTRSDLPSALATILGTGTDGKPVGNPTGKAATPVYSKAQADASAFVNAVIFG